MIILCRMLYPDFKMRYCCLGQAELASSSDNKTATYALMDKNAFGRERYRLGHTLVFFRAGALAFLEELRLATDFDPVCKSKSQILLLGMSL